MLRKLKNLHYEFFSSIFGILKFDSQYNGFFTTRFILRVLRPLRIKYINFSLKKVYFKKSDIIGKKYIYYPLHKEPEVTLLIYGKSFANQIENIKSIARSLPIGYKLLIKEHPAGLGYRPLKYYKKITSIPRVELLDPIISNKFIIKNSKLIAVVSGTAGFESIILKKPVICFGKASFSILPDKMIKDVKDLDNLPSLIKDMINNYTYDEHALIAYINAVKNIGIDIDWYSILLGRNDVVGNKKLEKNIYDKQISKLSNFILKSINN